MLLVISSTSQIDPDKSVMVDTLIDPIVAISCYKNKKHKNVYYTIKIHTKHDNTWPESHDDEAYAKERLNHIIRVLYPSLTDEHAIEIVSTMPFQEFDY